MQNTKKGEKKSPSPLFVLMMMVMMIMATAKEVEIARAGLNEACCIKAAPVGGVRSPWKPPFDLQIVNFAAATVRDKRDANGGASQTPPQSRTEEGSKPSKAVELQELS